MLRTCAYLALTLGLTACGGKKAAPPAPVTAPTLAPTTSPTPPTAPPATSAAVDAPPIPAEADTVAAPAPAAALDPAEQVDIAGGVVPRELTKGLVIPPEKPAGEYARSAVATTAGEAYLDTWRTSVALLRTPLRRWFLVVDGSEAGITLELVAPDNVTRYALGTLPPHKVEDCESSGFGCTPYTQGSISGVFAERDSRELEVTLDLTHGDRQEGPSVTKTFPIPEAVLARAAKLEELPAFEPDPEPEDPVAPGEPTGKARAAIYELVREDGDLELVDIFFEGGQVGAGELLNAARVDRIVSEPSGSTRQRWLLLEGPDGWTRIPQPLTEKGVVGHGHEYEHHERRSELVQEPTLGAVLVIEVERAHTYSWGAETTQVRWYCFVHERRPRCVEVALAYLKEDNGDAPDPQKVSWERKVTLDKGHLVVTRANGDEAPGPAPGRHVLVGGAIEGLVTLLAEPVSSP